MEVEADDDEEEELDSSSEGEQEESEDEEPDAIVQPSQKSGKSYKKSNKHKSKYPLVSSAHIRAGVVSLYPDPSTQTLNIYDSPILPLTPQFPGS